MPIKNYNFDKTEVTAILKDSEYFWIAFLGASGLSPLRKASATDLNQIFYEFDVSADKIVDMKINGDYLYLIVEDSSSLIIRYNKFNPLSGWTSKAIPSGIYEYPIDLIVLGSNIFILFPGILSGENAKVVKYNLSPTYQTTINLARSGEVINNASSIESDGTNLWVTTNEDPARLVKIYELSGGDYTFTSYILD